MTRDQLRAVERAAALAKVDLSTFTRIALWEHAKRYGVQIAGMPWA